MEDLLQVGAITQTHGIRGEVKVFPLTDDVGRFKKGISLILDLGRSRLDLEVETVKFFKQFVILKFKGYDSINEIEKFVKKNLYVTRENAVKLKKDEYFIADLIGLTVVTDDGSVLGTLTDVITTGANDVYAVKMESGKELLIPAIHDCILQVNDDERKMTVHLLDGLLDEE